MPSAELPPVTTAPAARIPGSSKRQPKSPSGSAWNAWQATGDATTGSQFLQGISSWLEGTAAQLLRLKWPLEKSPTSTQVQDRLRHHLAVVATNGQATYLEALALARRNVIEDLRGASW
jgi:hypothetical protein